MARAIKPPSRGDLVEIAWVDIMEDPTGDPESGQLCRRTSYALYWGERVSAGVPAIITTNTKDEDVNHQQGYCIYPKGCVVKVTVVKRARRERT